MSLICDCCGRGFRGSVEIPEHDCAAHPTPEAPAPCCSKHLSELCGFATRSGWCCPVCPESPSQVDAPAAPKPPRPAYGDPSPVTEGWDDDHDRAIYDSVGWDLAFGCTIAIGHEHAYDGDPEQWSAGVALSEEQLRSAGCLRTVTPAQVVEYARQLLALVARHAASPAAPVGETPPTRTDVPVDPFSLPSLAVAIEQVIEECVRGEPADVGWLRDIAQQLRAGSVAANSDTTPGDVRDVADASSEQPSTPPAEHVGAEADGVLWMAMRYALGRATYAPTEVLWAIQAHAHRLPTIQREQMAAEIDQAITGHAVGMDCDVRTWEQAAAVLRQPPTPPAEPPMLDPDRGDGKARGVSRAYAAAHPEGPDMDDEPPAEVRTERPDPDAIERVALWLFGYIWPGVLEPRPYGWEDMLEGAREGYRRYAAEVIALAAPLAEVRTEWGVRMASGRLFGPYPAEQALSPVDRGRGGVSMSREVHTWVGPWTPTVPPEATDD